MDKVRKNRRRSIVFGEYLINLHILSYKARVIFDIMVSMDSPYAIWEIDDFTTETSIEILRELNSLYYQKYNHRAEIYSVFDYLVYDEETKRFKGRFANKHLMQAFKSFLHGEHEDLSINVGVVGLKGKYTLALMSLLLNKLPNGGTVTVPYDEIIETIPFPASFRSTHVILEIDKAIKEIQAHTYLTYMIGYNVERPYHTNKRKKPTPTGITFVVNWNNEIFN